MATKRHMKGWDTRVEEAPREPIVIPMEGVDVIVHPMLGSDVQDLMKAQREGDTEAQVRAIFREHADHVLKVFADAPFAAGQGLMEDILVEFGVIPGNR